MSTIKGLSEKNRNLLFELVKEIKAEGYAEGFEAGKLVDTADNVDEIPSQVVGATSKGLEAIKLNDGNHKQCTNCFKAIFFTDNYCAYCGVANPKEIS